MSKKTFVGLFLGFILSATGVHTSCPIELNPPSVVVRYGDSVSVNCSTSESSFGLIGWETSQGGTSTESTKGNHTTWTVESLRVWTPPLCFISPSHQSHFKQCSKTLNIVVYMFPENISIISSGRSDGVMIENENYKFTCNIHQIAPVRNLTVRWYKGGTINRTDSFDNERKEPVNQSSVYGLKPTRQDNGVTYRCEAYMNLGPEGPQLNVSSQEYKITVYYGPDLPCSVIELLEGEALNTSECQVEGNPTPVIKWQKDNKVIDTGDPVTREDTGVYTVEAVGNSHFKKNLQVHVLYGPELNCPSNYTALEHAPLNFTCTAQGYPKPVTTWYKDGEEVELPGKLKRRDAGQYLIIASNKISTVNFTVDIIVKYPPSEIVELEHSVVKVGSTVWLKCSSMGNPRPNYLWTYYRMANVIEETEDGVSRLLIENATAYNMGSYTCNAFNDIGHVFKTVTVNVTGVKAECPIKITPERMVVQYKNETRTAKCKPMFSTNNAKVSWGSKTSSDSWNVNTTEDWNASPVCTATFDGLGTCNKSLNFTFYRTPEGIFIHQHNLSSMVVGRMLQLQCDIINVAPAQNLAVRWYQGNDTIRSIDSGSLRVTGCRPENSSNCDIGKVKYPVTVSSTISVLLDRRDNGTQFRCEAVLDLGPEGPQPPPTLISSPVDITVSYKPIINTTKLPRIIPVFRGYPEELVCEADGHPPPKIQWFHSSGKLLQRPSVAPSANTLSVSEAGMYNCSATNEVGSIYHVVEVILKGRVLGSPCQVEMDPPEVVVRYGNRISAICRLVSTERTEGMGWESTAGGTGLKLGVTSLLLNISSVTEWDFEPQCYINFLDRDQCIEILSVKVYKLPDSVSASLLSQPGPMVEGEMYMMRCDIANVAPAKNLYVNWHKGNKIIYTQTFNESSRTPVNKTSELRLKLHRDDNGAQIWCEAGLKFSQTGSNPPMMQSKLYETTVLYPPTFTKPENETLEITADSKMILNCTATGNPTPTYSWQFPYTDEETFNNQEKNQPVLNQSFQFLGTYSCTASSNQGAKTKYFIVNRSPGNRTTFAALVGGFSAMAVMLLIVGLLFVTPEGTLSFSKSNYLRGQPTSSGPV